MEGRIDLVWESSDGGVCLLDYKTDRVDEAGARTHGRHLLRQLEVYWLALTRLLEQPPERAGLFFLRAGIEVPLAQPAVEVEVEGRLREMLKQMAAGPYPKREDDGCPCGYSGLCR